MKYNCITCGKEIKNPYYLDGRIYGHECYKMAVALKYAHLQEMKNDDYIRKCVAVIETFRNKSFKDQWNKDFQTSILTQWDACQKLTMKQLQCIVTKFDKIEYAEVYLLHYGLSQPYVESGISCEKNGLLTLFSNQETLKVFKNDERLHEFLKDYYTSSIKRGKKFYILVSKDEDMKENYYEIARESRLEGYKNDEYTTVLEAIEI